MFTITKNHDEDIQDKDYSRYDILQLAIDDQVVFSTEDTDTLKEIAADQSTEGSWLLGADRNSQEQAELNQLRITKSGDTFRLEVQKKTDGEFESVGEATLAEFAKAVNSI